MMTARLALLLLALVGSPAAAQLASYVDTATRERVTVETAKPLPMASVTTAATSTPLVGTSTGVQLAGPFMPQLGRPITVALAGTWSGTVQLLRSTDGGATKLPLTPAGVTLGTYIAQGVDQPWTESEAGATFYLSLPAAGISYRVAN